MNEASIKRRLLIKYPFFGSIVANAKFVSSFSVKTAGTDGKTIYYNPNFMATLSRDEETFVFAHEVCHIAFNHIERSKGKDPKAWNKATDSVINAFLEEDGLPMVEGAVAIKEAINYDAEEMYEKLLKEVKQEENTSNKNNSTSQDVGHDTHSMWKKRVEKEENQNKEIKKLEELGEKEAFKENKKERKRRLEELTRQLIIQSHGRGHDNTNSESRNITDIGVSKPLIDWRKLLKEAIKYDVDWSYQNAEIEDGILTAPLEELPRPETEILLDTSGSINTTLLKNFLRECKNIIKTSKVNVGCFDTKFYGFTEIKSLSDIDNLKLYGGGGTNFDVAVNAFTRRVENKIIFTDGYANMPRKPMNAIWVVFGNDIIKPKGGKVIYINQNQLENLHNYQTENEKRPHSR